MAHWICVECANEVYTRGEDYPTPLPWSDGHRCRNLRVDHLPVEKQKEIIDNVNENRTL